ncbi:DUF2550 family protein [Actinobacteria bacterium YIM 96077]|uniref:DUF2550 domain-containing protein n=2 Tax=Phytoactinopolyspora halophila TaxID=1981511 RepID=A0A329QRC0_9ACTN|nr:DUF2550 family protein [Actinobacteria bacterium YIM 96077]RAW14895.1 DUF2550 domain-containing protein [Phytoactinopolyspora halophila]
MAILAVVVAASLVVLYLRRRVLQREGGFDMCMRVGSEHGWAGGWVFGIGRYRGEYLEWFRTFSFAPRPKRSFERSELVVSNRRTPDAEEDFELPAGHVVLSCAVGATSVEMSMTDAASTAFLAWLEAAPPGGHLVR